MNKLKITKELNFIFSIAKRFSRVDRKNRSAAASRLATAGLCFGVMTLVVVMSVMNGFQMSFIRSIQEISSYHVQVSEVSLGAGEEAFTAEKNGTFNVISVEDFCREDKSVVSCMPFMQAQTLMTHNVEKEGKGIIRSYESSAIIRAVPAECFYEDSGFEKELKIVSGFFNVFESGNIVLGSILADSLHVRPGDKVNLFVLSGGTDVDLFSEERLFTVTGIFSCGYQDINSGYCFISLDDGKKYFGKDSKIIYGIKLKNANDDVKFMQKLNSAFGNGKDSEKGISIKSWKEYNKAFFGTLRMEKNMMLLLICLIFVVVAINIYNGMRRLVFERQQEIAILSALGARMRQIQAVFVMRGLLSGFTGAFMGVLLGFIICKNMEFVFKAVSLVMYGFQYVFTAIFDSDNLSYVHENSAYSLYASIPAEIYGKEVFMIFMFGLIAPVLACFAASRNILKLSVTEVLHNE